MALRNFVKNRQQLINIIGINTDKECHLQLVRIDKEQLFLAFEFLNNTDDKNMMNRSYSEMEKAVEQQLVFAFIDESTQQIVGLGCAFQLDDSLFYEVGGCYVLPEYRGLGLQKVLLEARNVALLITQGSSVNIGTAIKPNNIPSLKNAKNAGFVQWKTPSKEFLAPCKGCSCSNNLSEERLCCYDYYLLSNKLKSHLVKEYIQKPSKILELLKPHFNMSFSVKANFLPILN